MTESPDAFSLRRVHALDLRAGPKAPKGERVVAIVVGNPHRPAGEYARFEYMTLGEAAALHAELGAMLGNPEPVAEPEAGEAPGPNFSRRRQE